METVSTGVLDKNKEIIKEVKIKPKNDLMYQDIQLHMSQTKKMKILSIMSNLLPNCCLKSTSKRWANMQEASGSTTPNAARTISCKAWKFPAEYPSWVARCDIKGSDGTLLNPIFWKKAQGQKHPGRWEIAERQIPSVKMLFKTKPNVIELMFRFQCQFCLFCLGLFSRMRQILAELINKWCHMSAMIAKITGNSTDFQQTALRVK